MQRTSFIYFIGALLFLSSFTPVRQATAQAPTYSGWTRDLINYYMFLPDDDDFTRTGQSMTAWNRLVGNNPSGPYAQNDWLIGYFVDANGNPIRDRLPTPNNGSHELGVLTSAQMATRGYDTWENLGANGVNFQWRRDIGSLAGVIVENDTFANPAITGDPAQFRKTMTHEFGHALGLSHNTFYFALMYPGTFRQPPNYSSFWYTRMIDFFFERSLLRQINGALGQTVWVLEDFADMAIWSQTHDNWGSDGLLPTTDVAPRTVSAGQLLTLDHLHVENRGTLAATSVEVVVYLSTDRFILSSDRNIGSFRWTSFGGEGSWRNGSINVRVPSTTPAGSYHVGMILTTPTSEISSANNTVLITESNSPIFDPVIVTVTN